MQMDSEERFYFTVKDLIERLKVLPQDLPVLVSGYKSGYENFFDPFISEVVHEPDNMYADGEFQVSNSDGREAFEVVLLERVMRYD